MGSLQKFKIANCEHQRGCPAAPASLPSSSPGVPLGDGAGNETLPQIATGTAVGTSLNGNDRSSGWELMEPARPALGARWAARVVVCIALLVLIGEGAAQVVNIADPNLEQVIREAVDKPIGDLTEADLQRLVVLIAPRRAITTLEGFTSATNLLTLDLSYNALSTVVLTPGFPSLEYALFRGNEITNFTATGLLPSLVQLGLSENFITDVTFLEQMPHLAYLELDYNELSVFDPSGDLSQLVWLNLAFNHVQNLGFLTRLPRLMNLFLDDNGLTNLPLSAAFTNLTWLTLDVNRIANLDFLAHLPKLANLELASNFAERYAFPDGLGTLQNLNLGENRLTNVVFAPDLTNLTTLYLDDNRFTQLPDLLPLYSLQTLDLDINQLVRILIPYSLTNLTRLEVDFNPLEELILPEVLATNRLASLVNELTNRGVTVLTYPFPPRLTNLTRTPNDHFEFVLQGMPATYDVLRSTDLASWNLDGRATNLTGTIGYSTAVPNQTGGAYYRARMQ